MGAHLTCFLLLTTLHAQTPAETLFETATPGYHYAFPHDHFNHERYQTEWWYYTGNVVATDGKHFGFELTFFRQAGNREKEKASPWDMRDLYLAHLALSDIDGGKFYHAERLNREGPEIAGASEAEQKVWNGNWQVRWKKNDQQLQAIGKTFTLNLTLHPEKPPVIQGENGISQKAAGLGHASHYISLTRLGTTGEITLNEKDLEVAGLTWMDHEFFTTQPDSNEQGWDWLAMQLNDGTELMLYHFRRQDGSLDAFSSGTYVDVAGDTTHLQASDFTLQPGGEQWKSPETGTVYPTSWKIQIPQLAISLEAKTRLPSQELTTQSKLAPSYWEGAIALTGSRNGRPLGGVGYLELTGYDHSAPPPLAGTR
jgi:predicted secreted hydrolase